MEKFDHTREHFKHGFCGQEIEDYLVGHDGGVQGTTLPLGEEVAVAGQADDVGHLDEFVGVLPKLLRKIT